MNLLVLEADLSQIFAIATENYFITLPFAFYSSFRFVKKENRNYLRPANQRRGNIRTQIDNNNNNKITGTNNHCSLITLTSMVSIPQ